MAHDYDSTNIFARILRGEIPNKTVMETDHTLAFHDINPERGIFPVLERRGLAARVVTEQQVSDAVAMPPQTTRARLRGDFVRAATDQGRDFTVDWAQLKFNDLPNQVVICSDPFVSVDERVERLIADLGEPPR